MRILSILLVAVLALLALNTFAYGCSFVADPVSGLGEFGYDTSGDIDDGAKVLVGFVGAGFIGFAAFSVLAAWWVIRRNRAGLSVALVLGGTFLLVAAFAASKQLWMDAGIYGSFAAAVTVLAGLLWVWRFDAGNAVARS